MTDKSHNPKIEFQLTAGDGSIVVRAEGPGGEGRSEGKLPDSALLDTIAEADPSAIPAATLEETGLKLFETLADGEVGQLVDDALRAGVRQNQAVQFELRFDADQAALTQFPWEMIRTKQGQTLVRDGLVDMTRYITYPQAPPDFKAEFQELPLMRVVSSPKELPPIEAMKLSLDKIDTVKPGTFEQMMRRLLIERVEMWGLQFDGHGALVVRCKKCDTLNGLDAKECHNCETALSGAEQVGALAFEGDGKINWVPTDEFGSVLYNAQIRIALLMACESAAVGDRYVFSGLAAGLLLAGVPAVLGMQYRVLDDFANSFANNFYEVLLESNDVLEALRVARRMNIQGAWYSPALYLRHQKKQTSEESATYHSRQVDTAAPAQAQAGSEFLALLWIRRPETKPLSLQQLRRELGLDEEAEVSSGQAEAQVKLEKQAGRKLRRGKVEARLAATDCKVMPESVPLFVDEDVDAPLANFIVKPQKSGKVSLVFTLWQDGGQIASLVQHVEVVEQKEASQAAQIATGSQSMEADDNALAMTVEKPLELEQEAPSRKRGKKSSKVDAAHADTLVKGIDLDDIVSAGKVGQLSSDDEPAASVPMPKAPPPEPTDEESPAFESGLVSSKSQPVSGDDAEEGASDDIDVGDKIVVGNISGSEGIAIGRGAQASVTKSSGVDLVVIEQIFDQIFSEMKNLAGLKEEDLEDATAEIEELKQEVAKGDDAVETFLTRRFRNLGRMAPDLLDMVTATLINPAIGLDMVIRNIAEKAREEAGLDPA